MKKTAKRYTRLQLFVRKLIPSFFISLIILSLITALMISVLSRSMDNLNSEMLNSVSHSIYSASEEYNGEIPEENPVFRNRLELIMSIWSGGMGIDSESGVSEHTVIALCDAQTYQVVAGPEKNIYLLNHDGKELKGVYKADESVYERLLELFKKYPDSVFRINAAYVSETGRFIPEKIEITDDNIINESVDFSDTDKKDYLYTELGEKANIQSYMFEGYSDPEETAKRIAENSAGLNAVSIADNLFDPKPVMKKNNIHIGNRNYILVTGTEESFIDFLVSFEGILSAVITVTVITLLMALSWSRQKYAELKVHYDTEDFRKELTNTMAHDLKSPLMAASGYAENLLNRTNPEKNDHYAQALLENINYMDTIITDVLELSKLESGSEILSRTPVQFRTLAEEIVKKAEDIISERSLSVNVTGECQADADCSLMKRAIENLILNAAKYADEGSEIKVILSKAGITVENRYSGVEITDTDRLLEPFVKGDRSRSSRKGSGLGLSIVKNIADMHGFRFNISASGNVFRSEIRFKK